MCLQRLCGVWHLASRDLGENGPSLAPPFDTHVLLTFKVRLYRAYQSERVRDPRGNIDAAGLVRCVVATIGDVLKGRAWRAAFDEDGCAMDQIGIRHGILKELGVDARPIVGGDRPALACLRYFFPQRWRVPIASVLRAVDRLPTTSVVHTQ